MVIWYFVMPFQTLIGNHVARRLWLMTKPIMNNNTVIEVALFWFFKVYSNPTLCMSAQLNPAALPNGSIPMAAVTPLAGLIRWCALAPLCIEESKEGKFINLIYI